METMFSVRHLTLKLRSQSLNEDSHHQTDKSDPDRDSGTESDDELVPIEDHLLLPAIDDRKMDSSGSTESLARRSSAGRERTRSDSGKENSVRSAGRNQRRSERNLIRERYTESVMASTLAAVAALSASDDSAHHQTVQHEHADETGAADQRTVESPVEFCVTDSALPSDSDHGPWGDQHSSEEELECINETAAMLHDSLTEAGRRNRHGAEPAVVGTLRTLNAASARVAALRFGPSAFGPPGGSDVKLAVNNQRPDRPHRRSGSNPQQGPEKRKWERVQTRRSGVATTTAGSGEWTRGVRTRPRSVVLGVQQQQQQQGSDVPERNSNGQSIDCCYSASSDDEVQSLVGGSAASVASNQHHQESPLPVQFRTSPPEGAHRPTRSLSPPPKFFLAEDDDEEEGGGVRGGGDAEDEEADQGDADEEDEYDDSIRTKSIASANANAVVTASLSPVANGNVSATAAWPKMSASPRKRHRHHHGHHRSQKQPIQRPCLDFEKMQQMKNRSLSTWRHDGELSLFCW